MVCTSSWQYLAVSHICEGCQIMCIAVAGCQWQSWLRCVLQERNLAIDAVLAGSQRAAGN